MVLLNYNFISTHVDTRGNTRYFAYKMQKFPVEIIISTWQDVVFPHDETWYFHMTRRGIPRDKMRCVHETSHSICMRRDQLNGIWEKPTTITTTYLANVATRNRNLWASAQFEFLFAMHIMHFR